MTHVLTFVADSQKRPLSPADIATARGGIPGVGEPDWLSPGEACDLRYAPDTEAAVMQTLGMARQALEGLPVDIVNQPLEHRRKRLLVADMDSTLIGQECIDELADFAGLKPRIAAITERAMRGELEFEAALRERVGLLKGLGEDVLQKVFDERITLTPGARTLARTMAANGATAVIVSGGFTYFTGRVAQEAGFNENHANVLNVEDGKLTGTVREPILGQQAKLDTLCSYRQKLGLGPQETMAVGDGANDLAMIMEAGLGVAFRAKPVVAEKATTRIDHGDLTALLFAQGYRREEFVTG